MMRSGKTFFIYQLPAILFAVAIFISSSVPDPLNIHINIRFEDKWKHIAGYGIFGILIARALYYQVRYPSIKKNYIGIAIVLGVLYGISDEFHQSFVPGRFTEAADVLADSIGIVIGVMLFYRRDVFYKIRKKMRIDRR